MAVEPKSRRRMLIAIGSLALGLLLLSYSRHLSRCGGTLEHAPAPPNWRALPAVGTEDVRRLGRFRLHASHLEYKGYPSGYGGAALGDPGLCFGITISLASWFDRGDAMYRTPFELLLRSAPSGTYVVSGKYQGASEPEQLVTSFRRNESPTVAFDSSMTRNGVAVSTLFLTLGTLLMWRKTRARLAFVALFASSCSTLVLETRWSFDSNPRPGRELAQYYPMIM